MVAETKKTTPAPERSAERPTEKKRALDAALSQIEKQYGKGSIMTLAATAGQRVQGISTGSPSLDLALGGQGVPRGRITEVFGPESSGKTTLCSQVIAHAQKAGGVCAFIDAEHAFDAHYARALGVNLDELLVSQPDTGEQALEIAETLIRSHAVDVIVIDSVAALVPKAEIEGDMGDQHVGLQARLMSQALRKLSGAIRNSNAVVMFTNQMRMKIGVMFGNPETTTGGNALKFYASVRIDMRRIGSLKGAGDAVVGNRVRAKVVKNKIAPPFRQAEFDILFGRGIDRVGDLVDLASNGGVIDKSGTWLSWTPSASGTGFAAREAVRLGQGREKAIEFLRANPDLLAALEKETMAALTAPGAAAPVAPPSPATVGSESIEDGEKAESPKAATTPAPKATVAQAPKATVAPPRAPEPARPSAPPTREAPKEAAKRVVARR
jgi:recombination protein RecA